MAQQHDGIIRAIGAFKLVKAAMLITVGAGALSMMHGNGLHELGVWIKALGIDPESHWINRALGEVAHANPRQFKEIGAGSLIYAGLFLIEGTGLLMRKVWAEYVTIVITTSFVPLEVYEMIEHRSVTKAIIIVLNIAIVIYLVLRLRSDKHWPFRR